MNLAKAVFLDRDGVLNRLVERDGRSGPPRTLEEFEILPEARRACSLLTREGYLLVVVTNQPEVGRGLVESCAVEQMHAYLTRNLPIRRIEVSFDAEDTPAARRRKPAPGMLLDAAVSLKIDLSQSWMVGDSWRDIECGRRAGCKTLLIDSTGEHPRNLLEAAERILTPPESRDTGHYGRVSLGQDKSLPSPK